MWGYKRIVTASVLTAALAAVSFGAGVVVGNTGSAAEVVARIPLVGDGLDATPDPTVDLTNFWKAWNALQANYVQTNASSTLPTTEDMIYGAIRGLADAYGDPYTVFLPPEESKTFKEQISGSFGGVGMEIDKKDGILTVVTPLKGTPAEAAGIKAGDQVIAIDKRPTENLSVDEAVRRIRGPVGTTVELTILRGGKVMTLTVTRATIQVPEIEDGFDKNTGVYHITLYEFGGHADTQFTDALKRFVASKSRKLVLDLRGNPGGYLDTAVNIASYFLPKGAVVVTEDFDGKQENDVHVSSGYRGIPSGTEVVVLIDGGSASASEIVAGALQDHKAATIIGTKSFGKGSVQQLITVDEGSLKVTVARWITPDGHWIMGNGVTPDIVVPIAQADIDAKRDPQMLRAVRLLTTGK